MFDKLQITQIKECKDEFVNVINGLLSQLSSKEISFTRDNLLKIISSDSSYLYFMYCDNNIVGMFTLCSSLSPSGRKFWLEDVVIDYRYRGNSFGKILVNKAIEIVSAMGNSTLMLTSKPTRIIANNLYLSSGFQKKDTNVYKMDFK